MVFVATSYSYHVLFLYDFIMNVCKTNSLFVKECFGNVRYDIRFRKLMSRL